MNLSNYILFIILCNDVTQDDIPSEYIDKPTARIDENDVSTFLPDILKLQKKGHMLIATKNANTFSLINAVNQGLKNNKISIMFNGKIDTSALESEMRNKALHTKDGILFLPEPIEEHPCLLHCDNRLIMLKKPTQNEEVIFNASDEIIGVLLNDSLKYEDIIGTIDCNLDKLCVKEKALLFLKLLDNCEYNTIGCFKNILMLKNTENAHTHRFIHLTSTDTQNVYEAELELFTGMTTKNSFSEIISVLTELSLPMAVREDIYQIVTNCYVSRKCSLPKIEQIINTMKRIIVT